MLDGEGGIHEQQYIQPPGGDRDALASLFRTPVASLIYCKSGMFNIRLPV